MTIAVDGANFGWREWVALPQLRIRRLRTKVDTGAKTSALHAFEIAPFERAGKPWVRFGLHVSRQTPPIVHWCEAPVLDQRWVTDSGGHTEERYTIASTVVMGRQQWPIAITLTNRHHMRFRMLLGRDAMPLDARVFPHHSFLMGMPEYDPADFKRKK